QVWFLPFCSFSYGEDDLICTLASSSHCRCCLVGIPPSSLNKLNASIGAFKLSGYISDKFFLIRLWSLQRCPWNLATSKYCLSDDMHAFPASFGLKGEALGSTSDVSLMEIVTKSHRRPDGYRNFLKGRFCRQDVGATGN
ncbi:hypothetical protein EJD97_002673, partial [Solanum chilense]